MLSLLSAATLGTVVRLGARPLLGVIINDHWLSAAETRARVESLGRRFELIHHDQLAARLCHPRARPFCLLSFDDGKRSNVTETAPELLRLGAPAVFYLTTGFIGRAAPLWFDRLAALARTLGRLPPALDPDVLKQLPFREIEERLDRACAEHRVTVDLRDDRVAPMSWDDARALALRGFELGAHSVQHGVLTSEAEPQAFAEIAESLRRVSEALGAPCKTFAFPNGNYTEALARHAQACGAETVMTTDPQWVGAHTQLWRLPRIQLYPGNSRARIELKLSLAAAGRILPNPDGTGRLYVKLGRCEDKPPPFAGRLDR